MPFPISEQETLETLKSWVRSQAQSILITGHKDPDIDAIGSCIAFKKVLDTFAIPNIVWFEDSLETYATHLPSSNQIKKTIPTYPIDTLIILDSPHLGRIRNQAAIESLIQRFKPMVINIDHHPDNTLFGNINIVKPGISSVGELLFHIFSYLNWPISSETASCLYAAISFDTGRFLFSNVTERTFLSASKLLRAGAKAYELSQKMYENKTLQTFDLIQIALSRMVIDNKKRFAYTTLPIDAPEGEMKVIDFIRQLGGIDVFVVFSESKNGEVKLNLRSKGGFNVSKFAAQFGGGGHALAAGITMQGTLEEVTQTIIQQLDQCL